MREKFFLPLRGKIFRRGEEREKPGTPSLLTYTVLKNLSKQKMTPRAHTEFF
jgi:hypothetical protein